VVTGLGLGEGGVGAAAAVRGRQGRLAAGHAGADMWSRGERVRGIGIRGGRGCRGGGGWWAARELLPGVAGRAVKWRAEEGKQCTMIFSR
jgi:hypothetical protein